jgi:hypothetical protein
MSEPIAIIKKNSVDEVRVTLSEYRGRHLLDLRIFTELDNSDEKVPTKRGVNLRVEQLPELLQALEQARAVAVERGFLKKDAA